MKRYHITLGASTTAGGKVITASSCCAIDGIAVAVEGDTLFCTACKAQGTIHIFGARIPESWNGKQVALQDDLCVCKCATPPRLIAIQQFKYQTPAESDDPHAAEAAVLVASIARQNKQAAAIGQPDEQIALCFRDDFTQLPLALKRYRLEFPDRCVEGHTDASGYTTPFSASDRARLIAWQILE